MNQPVTILSANSDRPAETTSTKYSFFDSKLLIHELFEKGWVVYLQTEAQVRNPKRQGFQRHMIIFNNKEFNTPEGKLQIVIRNAHDTSCSVEIFSGFMRIACENQLFTKDLGTGSLIRIRHTGDDIQTRVMKGFQSMIEFLPTYGKLIYSLQERILSPLSQEDFAKQASLLRFGTDSEIPEKIRTEDVLQVRRKSDEGNSAWKVYNRVQENLVRGGLPYPIQRKSGLSAIAYTRRLRSLNTLPEFNDSLMDLLLTKMD
jgi:hypothetical protein